MATNSLPDLDRFNDKVNDVEIDNEEGGSELDLATLFVVTRKSLIWMILLILLGLTASYLFIRYTKPVFKSSSTIKINEQSQAVILGIGGFGTEDGSALQGEVSIIKSDLIYEKLKEKLNLKVNYYAVGNVLNEELYNASPFKIGYEIKDPSFYDKKINVEFVNLEQVKISYFIGEKEISETYPIGKIISKNEILLTVSPTQNFNESVLDQKYYFTINSDGNLNNYLNTNLTVDILNPSAKTLAISFTDNNPFKARDIVNKIDSSYLDVKIFNKNKAMYQTLSFLDDQLQATKDSLDRSERAMEAYALRNRAYGVKGNLERNVGLIEGLQEERINTSTQLAKLRVLQDLIDNNIDLATDNSIEQFTASLKQIEDAELAGLLSQFAQLQLEYNLLLSSYKQPTEAVKRLEKRVDFIKSSATALIAQDIQLARNKLNKINTKLITLEEELQQVPQKETERARLSRFFGLYEGYYLSIMNKKVEFGISKAGTIADFQILSPANIPTAPIYPQKLLVYAIGLASGLVLGIGLIGARYLMHNTVTSLGEIERNTKASVLGVVPRYTKEKLPVSKLIVDKNPKSAISESIRSIRTNLEFISSSKKKRLISITSTVSGEGKTFVAVNLGGIIALSEQKVVILDLDLRKPKVNIAFDAENTIGISTILIEKHTVQECIQKTSVENLDFIPAGPTPPNPSELILNAKFDEMLEELHQTYDVIIVDTPPIGLVTDGILVMRKADIPIYIVRADYSKKAFLKNINKVMKTNNFTKLTVVLNDAKGMGVYGYGYGYGYEYGYGNSYYEEEVKEGFLTRLRKNFT